MSTITGITPFVLNIPVHKPGVPEPKSRYLAGALLHASNGLVGTGISAVRALPEEPFPPTVLEVCRGILVGRDPTDIRTLWEELADGPLTQSARSIIDIALWDLCAQQAELPLHRLLGSHKSAMPTYVTVGDPRWDTEQLVGAVGELMADGWTAIKVKVGVGDPVADARRIVNLRRECGPELTLMADANQRWTLPQAQAFARAAAEANLLWLEEPCAATDVRAHAELARTAPVAIALGENVNTRHLFRDFLVAGAVHYLQADVTRLAGVTEWLAVAGMAECFEVVVVPHHSEFGQVQQHLVGAARAATMLEFPWPTDVFAQPITRQGMTIPLPELPGASTALTEKAFR